MAYNKPGLSPTTKNGTDVGWVNSGFVFTAGAVQNGWLAILPNKWVKLSDCEVVSVTPPPDEPPPVEKQRAIIQTFNGIDWVTTETWERLS